MTGTWSTVGHVLKGARSSIECGRSACSILRQAHSSGLLSWRSALIKWFAAHAEEFVYVNLVWYLLLSVMFALGMHWGKAVYFAGAAVLTVGVIMMK